MSLSRKYTSKFRENKIVESGSLEEDDDDKDYDDEDD